MTKVERYLDFDGVQFLPAREDQRENEPVQRRWDSECVSAVWPAGGEITDTVRM